MEKYICENVFVPLRSAPTHRAEMLSQILFGEKYQILDHAGHWMKVETLFDKFTGWIDTNHLQQTPETDESDGFVLNRSLLCYKNDKTKMVLEAGCEIFYPDFEKKTFLTGNNKYTTIDEFNHNFINAAGTPADIAARFINSPYIWGGRLPSGIDCSGFTQLVYKICGKPIPRNSWMQAEIGETINFLEETKPGDLAFFDNEIGRISHVGLIVSRGLIIHASGRVRIDPFDHQGIFKQELSAYSHHLRTIKRIV